MSKNSVLGAALFFGSLALYIHSAGPSVVAYRDAGEMATTVPTLGILHPTSYPAYSILGNLFSRIPLGNPAYRLNIFSALCLSGAWGLLFLFCSELADPFSASVIIFMGATSYHFWTHALVSEMYSLNLLFLTGIMVALQRRRLPLAAFLLSLGLSNRVDLLLVVPALGFLALKKPISFKSWPKAKVLFFFAVGLSAYLYLPLRAAQNPWMNWNNPSSVENLLRTLLRSGYGNTLDLLSRSYRIGENFLPELGQYVKHLFSDFLYVGLALALVGGFFLWNRDRAIFGLCLTGFFISGILFIFLGNLPINPHAVAIMQAGYLVPDMFLLVLMAVGLSGLFKRWSRFLVPLSVIIFCINAAMAVTLYPHVNRRSNFLAVDFSRNVFHSVPQNSFVVAKSDVPLFSLFYSHWISPHLADRWPLAQGLLMSTWYEPMMALQVPGIKLNGLQALSDWAILAQENPRQSLFATYDFEWPADPTSFIPEGLLLRYPKESNPMPLFPNELLIFRGPYRYDGYRDFFSSELVEEASKAFLGQSRYAIRQQKWSVAQEACLRCLAIKWDQPYAAFSLGFMAFQSNDFSKASYYFAWTVDAFRQLLAEAEVWKSFPEVKKALRLDLARALAQRGTCEDRLGHFDNVLALNQQALREDPTCADALFNMAVLYWKQGRWAEVVDSLQTLAGTHPEDPRWKSYLAPALAHLKKEQQRHS